MKARLTRLAYALATLAALAAALGVTVALTVNGAVLLALGTAVMLLSRRLRGL